MIYQVLARKWRPRDFASLVGQEHVVRALTHALEQQRLHHAYLFTGTRGVGKTTLSRILAKALNCEKGISATPCGVCRACVDIDAGRFVDYVEMDAASNRGVEEMAALLERAVYAPVDARFKVYMIDEVHMLTNHAFNAMLKTLEEPPAHVKFILATTDPQKIPVTVLSRCLQFNLKQMPAGQIVEHLQTVLASEEIAFEPPALRLLARAAQGSMRDALSLTDQAIAFAAGDLKESAVRSMLGVLDQEYLVRLLDAVIAPDGAAVLAVASEMAERSLSFASALQDLAQLLHRIAWAQAAPSSVLDDWPEAGHIRRFAGAIEPERVQLFYQIATVGRGEFALAPDDYAGFTMPLLRMLAFDALQPPGGSGSRLDSVPSPASRSESTLTLASEASAATARAANDSSPPLGSPVSPVVSAGAVAGVSLPRSPVGLAAPAAAAAPNEVHEANAANAREQGGAAPVTLAPVSPARAALNVLLGRSAARQAEAPLALRAAASAVQSANPVQAAGETAGRPNPAPSRSPSVASNARHRSAPAALADEEMPPWEEIPASAYEQLGETAPEPELESVRFVPSSRHERAEEEVAAGEAEESPGLVLSSLGFAGDWPTLAATLDTKGLAQQLAYQSEAGACEAGRLSLRVANATLASGSHVEKLRAALEQKLGAKLDLVIEVAAARVTAAAAMAREQARRQREAERAVAADPFVQAMIRECDAQIQPGSTRPIAYEGAGRPPALSSTQQPQEQSR